jgi:1,2-diacylglycerol 3-beta-glucosyltransferase
LLIHVISGAAAIFSVVALLGSVYILLLAFTGAFSGPADKHVTLPHPSTHFLILVPAHNEEKGIAASLRSFEDLAYPVELHRVVVIADNCSDSTAAVVEQHGTECWVRNDVNAPGKGQALRWAIERAWNSKFDAVVVVDADTEVSANMLSALDGAIANGARVAQVRYDFRKEDGNGIPLFTVIGKHAENTFFWRPRSRSNLSLFLQGNGFCLSRSVLSEIPWSAGSIVEDLEYSMMLVIRRIPVAYLESAKVMARSVVSTTTATPQRLRWASGTFQMTVHWLPRLLIEAVRQRSGYIAEAACGLLFISRVLLVYLTAAALMLWLIAGQWHFSWVPGLILAAMVCQFLYVGLVLRTSAADRVTWRSVLSLPGYVVWICVVQCLALCGLRRDVWTRTVR